MAGELQVFLPLFVQVLQKLLQPRAPLRLAQREEVENVLDVEELPAYHVLEDRGVELEPLLSLLHGHHQVVALEVDGGLADVLDRLQAEPRVAEELR
jgi:hypothetical protein